MNKLLVVVWGLFALLPSFVFGDLDTFVSPGAMLDVADLRIIGEAADDLSGRSVACAGDVDGDGLSDVLIGAFENDDGGNDAGKTYLFLGSSLRGIAGDLDASMADYTFVGEASGDNSSYDAIDRAGDLDGDGLDDIVIGAYNNDDGGVSAGKTYIVYASTLAASSTTEINLSAADCALVGEAVADYSGGAVAGVGDIDGDGYDDLLVTAHANDDGGTHAGKVYLMLGGSLSGTLNLSSAADYMFIGERDGDAAGGAISGAGDVDGDGLADILIGSFGSDEGGASAGKVYFFYGSSVVASGGATIDLSDADHTFIGEAASDQLGEVAGAGDLDGDGLDDLLMSAYWNDDGGSEAGKTYLFLATNIMAQVDQRVDLADADRFFIGESSSDKSGGALSFAGDVDGDGLADVFIGAYGVSASGSYSGESYLLLAASILSNTNMEIDLSEADYMFMGEATSDYSGYSVSSAGDIDGNGLSEVMVSAYANDDGGSGAGKTYLIFSDRDCLPSDAVYVDGLLGSTGASGGEDCPVLKIQEGIDLADSLSITQVIVRGWMYSEAIELAEDVQVLGELRYFGTNGLMPYIINTNYRGYTVKGADDAALKYCTVIANYYTGGIELDNVDDMILQENVVYVPDVGSAAIWNTNAALYLHNGCENNWIENNMFYSEQTSPYATTVYLAESSEENEFLNNTMHRLYMVYNLSLGRTGMVVRLEDDTADNDFRNNILHSTLAASATATSSVNYTTWFGFYADTTSDPSVYEYNKTSANNYNITLGTGCITSGNPQFTSAAPYGFDYHIRFLSPCRNAGDPDSTYNDPNGSRNDMGVYGGPNSIDFLP